MLISGWELVSKSACHKNMKTVGSASPWLWNAWGWATKGRTTQIPAWSCWRGGACRNLKWSSIWVWTTICGFRSLEKMHNTYLPCLLIQITAVFGICWCMTCFHYTSSGLAQHQHPFQLLWAVFSAEFSAPCGEQFWYENPPRFSENQLLDQKDETHTTQIPYAIWTIVLGGSNPDPFPFWSCCAKAPCWTAQYIYIYIATLRLSSWLAPYV